MSKLPAPGERPYWVDQLDLMIEQIRLDCSDLDWSWTQGGCYAFADALSKAHNGELWGFCAFDDFSGDFPVHHAVVKIGGQFFDYSGVLDVQQYAKDLENETGDVIELRSKDDELVYWFTDDCLSDQQMKRLNDAFSTNKQRARPRN